MRSSLLAGIALLGFAASAVTAPASASVFVSALPSTPTLIGTLSAGQTYSVTALGIATLCSVCNSGNPLNFTADGKPTSPQPTGVYAPLLPNGSDHDPTGGSYPGRTGSYGLGGVGKLLGSLLGTFNAMPTGPADFFTIGLGTTLTATTNETLYGVINDTGYSDNLADTGFSVVLTQQAGSGSTPVPEPTSLALLAFSLTGLGLVCRSRRKTA